MKQSVFCEGWPSEKRLEIARERVSRLIDHLGPLYAMQAANKLVVYSPLLSSQIPPSRAGHAFNQFQRAMHQYAVIRLAAIWDRPEKDRVSLPTIVALVSSSSVAKLLEDQTYTYFATAAEPVSDRENEAKLEDNNFLSDHWIKERERCGGAERQLVGERLIRAVKAVNCASKSQTAKALIKFRNDYIAHNLEMPVDNPPCKEVAPRPMRFGDEARIFRLTTRVIRTLHMTLNGTDFQLDSMQNNADRAATELWENCVFNIEPRRLGSLP